jgi:hypothetical protein
MSRYLEKLELWVDRAFWNSKRLPNHHILIPCLTRVILSKEYENIMNHKCPYCDYISPTRHHLRNHVLAKHRKSYYSDIKIVVDAYLKLQKMIIKRPSNSQYNFVVDLPNMPRVYFKTKNELCIWIAENKDIVLPILTQ